MKTFSTNINGYIEGYYGRLLSWSEREQILEKLSVCNFNTYFYCPKEDLKHRLIWRKSYKKNWIEPFRNFCKNAKNSKINILVGISPGLDFIFKEKSCDFKILIKKTKQLKSYGATFIGLMFDDISPNSQNNDNKKPEGVLHAELANYLSEELNEKIFVVPRVYCDELIEKNCTYLADFGKTIKKDISIFYCGKKIIAETNSNAELTIIKKFTSNEIIFWDNLYANDYCPKKIFIGPYIGRSNFDNTMINPTGLINTDLFILDLIKHSMCLNNNEIGWKKILKIYKIPKPFEKIDEYFFPINYEPKINNKKFNYNKQIEALDFLLWKWKSSLSREWYQYMLILKQDLELLHGDLEPNRIEKIFPIPLKDTLLKIKWGNK